MVERPVGAAEVDEHRIVGRIAEKHDRESAEGRCAHKVSELRLEATPGIDHEEPALNVLMILDEDELPRLPKGAYIDDHQIDRLIGAGRTLAAEAVHQAGDPVAKREAWMALAECWIKPAVDLVPTVDGVGSVEITVMNGEELSYARSLSAPILDLRYLTTRAAWPTSWLPSKTSRGPHWHGRYGDTSLSWSVRQNSTAPRC
jgi:hypothetical protein